MAANPPGPEQGPSGVHSFLSPPTPPCLRDTRVCSVMQSAGCWQGLSLQATSSSHSQSPEGKTGEDWLAPTPTSAQTPVVPSHPPDRGGGAATPNTYMLRGDSSTHRGQERDPACSALDKPVQLRPSPQSSSLSPLASRRNSCTTQGPAPANLPWFGAAVTPFRVPRAACRARLCTAVFVTSCHTWDLS